MPISKLSPLMLTSLVECSRNLTMSTIDRSKDIEYKISFDFKARQFIVMCIIKGLTTHPEVIYSGRSSKLALDAIWAIDDFLAPEYVPVDIVPIFKNGFIPINDDIVENLYYLTNEHAISEKINIYKPKLIVDNVKFILQMDFPIINILHHLQNYKTNLNSVKVNSIAIKKLKYALERYNHKLFCLYVEAFPASYKQKIPEVNHNPNIFTLTGEELSV